MVGTLHQAVKQAEPLIVAAVEAEEDKEDKAFADVLEWRQEQQSRQKRIWRKAAKRREGFTASSLVLRRIAEQ